MSVLLCMFLQKEMQKGETETKETSHQQQVGGLGRDKTGRCLGYTFQSWNH
jgi:hypothetical protein